MVALRWSNLKAKRAGCAGLDLLRASKKRLTPLNLPMSKQSAEGFLSWAQALEQASKRSGSFSKSCHRMLPEATGWLKPERQLMPSGSPPL